LVLVNVNGIWNSSIYGSEKTKLHRRKLDDFLNGVIEFKKHYLDVLKLKKLWIVCVELLGYIGDKQAKDSLLKGFKTTWIIRGYDSAEFALFKWFIKR